MPEYIGLIRKESDRDYGVEFPDFPGCITAGSSLDEAKAMAQEALQGHVECMKTVGESIPKPSSIEIVMADSENNGAATIVISVSD